MAHDTRQMKHFRYSVSRQEAETGWSGAWPRCSRIWIGRPEQLGDLAEHVGEEAAVDQPRARAGRRAPRRAPGRRPPRGSAGGSPSARPRRLAGGGRTWAGRRSTTPNVSPRRGASRASRRRRPPRTGPCRGRWSRRGAGRARSPVDELSMPEDRRRPAVLQGVQREAAGVAEQVEHAPPPAVARRRPGGSRAGRGRSRSSGRPRGRPSRSGRSRRSRPAPSGSGAEDDASSTLQPFLLGRSPRSVRGRGCPRRPVCSARSRAGRSRRSKRARLVNWTTSQRS